MYLDKSPVVVQVLDLGDRFWVFARYDARTDQFSKVGKPYGSKPGFYLVVGPNRTGDVPAETPIYGKESNNTTWELAKMNLAIRTSTARLPTATPSTTTATRTSRLT